ncbi:glycosyltransferase family 2 protein [Fulvivirga ligni]|uniref:glycosyltransferase family 2 protein n=1 Tax=Fulvivirga ligni TaxID=2904246 RepID=UPI001F366DD6|nr:glycosyltransferase family 2 protein [Fulvivirga ligni]UII21819.1 glycosyltransferase family 2 protein [Fulvivirga ligni]
MIDVSVIIVNYNTLPLTTACINSIVENTSLGVKYEIIIVDNNSKNKEGEELVNKFPMIKLIQNSKNVGFGIANNQGMNFAKGRYYLLLNSDTYFLNDVLTNAVAFADENQKQYKIYGADIRNSDLSSQRSFFSRRRDDVLMAFKIGVINSNPFFYKYLNALPKADSTEVGGLYGAYIFLDRIVFEETKGFDPDFFMYCEETEWFRNRIKDRYRIKLCERSTVVHYGGGSSRQTIINDQNLLSDFLYWYKISYQAYWVYVIGVYFNSIFTIFLLPLMSKIERQRYFRIVKIRWKFVYRVFFDIPRYSNKYGSRDNSLVV